MHHAQTLRQGQKQPPLLVQQHLSHLFGSQLLARMTVQLQAMLRVSQAPYPRRTLQFHIHALRAVLKIPAAIWLDQIVAANELGQLVVLQQIALGAGFATGKSAAGLGLLIP